ncbi:MAG: hypothetical protein NVS4B8_07110 [Herpetosiphon sp.]
MSGNVHWTAAQSPVTLERNTLLAADSTLLIDPGVEVQLAPNVQFTVAGTLDAQGVAGAPVRFTGAAGLWSVINGQPGSTITLSGVEVRQGGASGAAVSSSGGRLTVRDSSIAESSGGIMASGGQVQIERTRITGNLLPFAPAIAIKMTSDGALKLVGNVVGNGVSKGTAQVRVQSVAQGSGPLEIEANVITAANGPDLELVAAAPLGGTIRCNSFAGGTIGLALNASTPSNNGFALQIDTNSFTGHTNYGLTSTIAVNAVNNWWSDASGPFEAQRNGQGKGERVGINVQFQPWLRSQPGCAPRP